MLRRQSLTVNLFYFLGYSRLVNLIYRFQRKPITRIVLFHDILPEAYRNFRANLEFLERHTHVISLDDFFAGRLSAKKPNIIITFDDGYKSWVTHAMPVLKELGLPAIFFVSSGFVGLSKVEEADYIRKNLQLTMGPRKLTGGLSAEDVMTLVKEGFVIGGHTISHSNLSVVHDASLARKEIIDDKKRLEIIIGKEIGYFAYPFGSHRNLDIKLVDLIKEAGYKGAVTTVPGFNIRGAHPYQLRRELTRSGMSKREFRARVYGNIDLVRCIKRHISKKKK
jgi:peptidoglycan/xylan/chitin deacetylase (PgdA/CDA1 family)